MLASFIFLPDGLEIISGLISTSVGLSIFKKVAMASGCVRSPKGKCIGWHALSEEEYQNELAKLGPDKEEEEENSEDPA